jgi:hypothetical protein
MKTTTHPTLIRARATAQALGSTATTTRGIVRALRNRPAQKPLLGLAQLQPDAKRNGFQWAGDPMYFRRGGYKPRAQRFTPEQRAAKRAAHDPSYKRQEAQTLRAAERAALRRKTPKTMIDVASTVDGIPARKSALAAVARSRKNLGIKSQSKAIPPVTDVHLLTIDPHIARRFGASITMTGEDATLTACLESSHGTHSDPHYIWRDGGGVVEQRYLPKVAKDGRAEYVRATHDNYVRAFAWLNPKAPARCEWMIHETVGAVTIPDGYRWASDHNGVHIVRESDGMDYHPTTKEIVTGKPSKLIEQLEENSERRLQQKESEDRAERDRFYFERDLPTVRVTIADSRAAGNCVEGSLAFAERKLHIPREEILAGGHLFSVPATRLLAAANGDKPRVEAAVRRAWMRETAVSI